MAETQKQSIGKQKAIELADSHWWELCDHREIAEFQLFTNELCCPFEVFHEALEKVLERPVWTHELGTNYDGIVAEFLGERDAPSMDEIIELIPEGKRIILELPPKETQQSIGKQKAIELADMIVQLPRDADDV